MKVFNRRNVLKGGLVGSMAAGFASFVGASHAAEPAAKAPAQNDKNTYDVIVLGAGPAGLVTAIAAKQAGAKKVVVFEKRDRPDGNAIFAPFAAGALVIRKSRASKILPTISTP